MATLKEHIYAIRNLLSKGVASDDTRYSLRLLAHLLNTARGTLIEQKADRYHYISEQSFQSLCIELEPGSFHNCCSVDDFDCKILKSKAPLPKFLNTRWGDFVKVMGLNGEVISKTSPTRNLLAQYTLTNNPPSTGWFIHDNHIYVVNNTQLATVLLNSLFQDPAEISKVNCETSNTGCVDWYDTEYPIDPDLVEPAYMLVINKFLQAQSLPPSDDVSDAQDAQTNPRV